MTQQLLRTVLRLALALPLLAVMLAFAIVTLLPASGARTRSAEAQDAAHA